MTTVPRYVPDLPLPPYAYLPGRFPHPTRDPGGHRWSNRLPEAAAIEPARWSECRHYLAGIDLFNHGYYWEAHEAWESVWHACGRKGPAADLLRGLIKLAAAGFKAREGRPSGVRLLATGAEELFAQVARTQPAARYLGMEVGALRALAGAVAEGDRLHDPAPEARVWAVFDFELRVE